MVMTKSQAKSNANPANSKAGQHSNHLSDDTYLPRDVPDVVDVVPPPQGPNLDEHLINNLSEALMAKVQAMKKVVRMLSL
ncbi:hypothetical protein CDL15_Pgr010769 [Punica granatum]|uniref:Uncharacterized protein n=1 Tax=Punica granatum TaxID=22663 RepID=A0A218W6G8_PUNGR|nr:hypothetical protein CDL15_Pgr010769 [Punica granatum]